jgi:acetyl-CoA synthetase
VDDIAWRADPDRARRTHIAGFMSGHSISTYDELEERSISAPDWFWGSVVDYLGIPFSRPFSRVSDSTAGPEWTTWFIDGELNMSEVCVDRWARQTPHAEAVVTEREDGTSHSLTYSDLHREVAAVAGGLRSLGVKQGDAVAVYLPMSAEAVISLLAVARLGAVFIPIFSGYGPEAVAGRLDEPRPKVLVCADGFTRRGRLVAMKETADEAVDDVGGLDHLVVVDYAGRSDVPWQEGRDIAWAELATAPGADAVPVPSEHPVIIAYTSGTTGRPKGAVHVHGGFTVKIAQEGAFQTDVHPGDRLMWATDMGWIMGPWMVVAGLANGAGIVTFDGAPDYPGPDRLWQIVAKHRLTHLGLSPTLVRALQSHGAGAAGRHDLSSLQVFGSTGEPWNPEPWWWLFRDIGQQKVPIVNLSGGTEIGACILSANLIRGIKPVALGGPSLGMAADVVDDHGRPLRNQVGELVIRAPWPGMTRGFWGEPERYLDTYWRRIPGMWVHGDWASIDADGYWYLHGRSDDTLNVAGKRVGPAEVESAVVALPEIAMAAAVGVPDPLKGETVAVFAVPAPGVNPDDELVEKVSRAVTVSLGKAFAPSAVRLVTDLPRTRSAKIMRRVVKALATGGDAGDLSSLENPESLAGIEPL